MYLTDSSLEKVRVILQKMQKALIVILSVITLVSGRRINDAGLKLIKQFEGFRANFYRDAVVSLFLKISLK